MRSPFSITFKLAWGGFKQTEAASWAWLESLKTMTFTFYKISIITLQHRSNARAFQLINK